MHFCRPLSCWAGGGKNWVDGLLVCGLRSLAGLNSCTSRWRNFEDENRDMPIQPASGEAYRAPLGIGGQKYETRQSPIRRGSQRFLPQGISQRQVGFEDVCYL